jgi:hypothetical protein
MITISEVRLLNGIVRSRAEPRLSVTIYTLPKRLAVNRGDVDLSASEQVTIS